MFFMEKMWPKDEMCHQRQIVPDGKMNPRLKWALRWTVVNERMWLREKMCP